MNTGWSIDCPVCGGKLNHEVQIEVGDPWFGTPGRFAYTACPRSTCRSLVLVPPPAPELLRVAYSEYYTHGASSSRLQSLLRSLVPRERRLHALRLPTPQRGDRLLDVGCGDGADIAALRRQGWDVAGIEPDPAARDVALSQGLTVYERLEDLPESGLFELAILRHVIEHVRNPLAELSSIRRLLADGGRLVAVTPNRDAYGLQIFGKYWRGFDAPRHLQVLSSSAMRSLAEAAGFEKVEVMTGASSTGGLESETFALYGRRLHLPSEVSYVLGRMLGFALGTGLALMNRVAGRRRGEEIFLVGLAGASSDRR